MANVPKRREPSRSELAAFEAGFQRGFSRSPRSQRQGQTKRRVIHEKDPRGYERIIIEEIEDYIEESWY